MEIFFSVFFFMFGLITDSDPNQIVLPQCIEIRNDEYASCLSIELHKEALNELYFLEYYYQINRAREKLLMKEYAESIEIYKKAFQAFEFQFARDCINASELAAYINDNNSVLFFAECCLKRGVKIEYFEENEIYSSFTKSNFWDVLISNAPKYVEVYNQSINMLIRKEIRTMFAEDQSMRKRYYAWYNFFFRNVLAKKWEKLNSQQLKRILEITHEYGFPGEKLIGIDCSIDHFPLNDQRFSSGMSIVIMIHHFSQANPSFDEILKAEVVKGNLFNEHYATNCDFQVKYGDNQVEKDGPYQLRFKFDIGEETINENRATIGLMSVKLMEQMNEQTIVTNFWKYLY